MPLPSGVVLARCRAFVEGDFNLIYDSYHPDSFFRRLYPNRESYLDYAREVLSGEFEIRECRILKEQTFTDEAWVLYYLDILYQGTRRESFEYCRLGLLAGEWRFLTTQKIERQDFSGAPEAIDWEDFERVEEKIIY
ncbi:MAG: hypothetical protein WDA20_10505 [Desulfuromonadales bacterium]